MIINKMNCVQIKVTGVPSALAVAERCRSASNSYPSSGQPQRRAFRRHAPPASALRRSSFEGGQLFGADPGQSFGAV
jgi:hypothetical protein